MVTVDDVELAPPKVCLNVPTEAGDRLVPLMLQTKDDEAADSSRGMENFRGNLPPPSPPPPPPNPSSSNGPGLTLWLLDAHPQVKSRSSSRRSPKKSSSATFVFILFSFFSKPEGRLDLSRLGGVLA